MNRRYSAIDRGLIKSEDFDLLNINSTMIPLENSLQITYEISQENKNKFKESEKVISLIKCDQTRLRYTEVLDKTDERLTFHTKASIDSLGDECIFSLYCINDQNFVIYKSHEYKIKINKPKLNIQTQWISFKNNEIYQWKKILFWVIEILNHETINIYFNKDISGFEEFVKRSHVKLRDKQDILWAIIGQHLKIARRFALEVDIANTQDDLIIDNFVNNLGSNNTFFKIADINVDDESSDLKLKKREAIFPFLKSDLQHKGESDPWLWLSVYLQIDILNTLKKIIKISNLLSD